MGERGRKVWFNTPTSSKLLQESPHYFATGYEYTNRDNKENGIVT